MRCAGGVTGYLDAALAWRGVGSGEVVYTLTRGTQVTRYTTGSNTGIPAMCTLYRDVLWWLTGGLFPSCAELLSKVKLCAFSSKNWFSLKFDLSLNEWYGIKMTTKDRCAFVKPICTNEHKISCFLHDAIYFSLREHICRTDRE